jgi:hypothetical protein
MSDVSTRRAIEICMSRLRMWDGVRDFMADALSAEIERGDSSQPKDDIDALRAALADITSQCSRIDNSMPKRVMLSRFDIIKRRVERAIRDGSDE